MSCQSFTSPLIINKGCTIYMQRYLGVSQLLSSTRHGFSGIAREGAQRVAPARNFIFKLNLLAVKIFLLDNLIVGLYNDNKYTGRL